MSSLANKIIDLTESESISFLPSSIKELNSSKTLSLEDIQNNIISEISGINYYKKEYNKLLSKYNSFLSQYKALCVELKQFFKEISGIPTMKNINEIISPLKEIEKVKKYILKINENLKYLDTTILNNNKNDTFIENEIISNEHNISVKFSSIDRKIECSILCKNNEKFSKIEKILYEKFPKFKGKENTFIIKNGKNIIRKNKTLIENEITNGQIICVYSI